MFLRVAALLIALAFPLPSQVPAQTAKPPAADLPDGRALIDKFVKAIGGRDVVLSHKSERQTGTVSMPQAGMNGTFEAFGATNPDRNLAKLSIPGIGDITTGFDGRHGWSVDPVVGPRLMVGNELDEAKLDSDFYVELRDPKNFPTVKTIDKADFEGHSCYKVRVTSATGISDVDYYDANTGLRVGSEQARDTPMGVVRTTSVFSDYKKFGNVLQPTTLVQRATGVEQRITITSVEYDNVDPAVFEPPAPIKALIK